MSAQPENSVRLWEEKVAGNPGSLVFPRLADSYRKRGDVPQAIEMCVEGLKANPKSVTGRIILARCYLEQENFNGAMEEFRTVCHYDRRNQIAIKMLADVYAKQGMEEKAGDLYALLFRLDPDNPSLAHLTRVYKGTGQTDLHDIIGVGPAPAKPRAPAEQKYEEHAEEADLSELGFGQESTDSTQDLAVAASAVEGEEQGIGDRLTALFGEGDGTEEHAPGGRSEPEVDLDTLGGPEHEGPVGTDAITPGDVSSRLDELFGEGGTEAPDTLDQGFEQGVDATEELSADLGQADVLDSVEELDAPMELGETAGAPRSLATETVDLSSHLLDTGDLGAAPAPGGDEVEELAVPTEQPGGISGGEVTSRLDEMFGTEEPEEEIGPLVSNDASSIPGKDLAFGRGDAGEGVVREIPEEGAVDAAEELAGAFDSGGEIGTPLDLDEIETSGPPLATETIDLAPRAADPFAGVGEAAAGENEVEELAVPTGGPDAFSGTEVTSRLDEMFGEEGPVAGEESLIPDETSPIDLEGPGLTGAAGADRGMPDMDATSMTVEMDALDVPSVGTFTDQAFDEVSTETVETTTEGLMRAAGRASRGREESEEALAEPTEEIVVPSGVGGGISGDDVTSRLDEMFGGEGEDLEGELGLVESDDDSGSDESRPFEAIGAVVEEATDAPLGEPPPPTTFGVEQDSIDFEMGVDRPVAADGLFETGGADDVGSIDATTEGGPDDIGEPADAGFEPGTLDPAARELLEPMSAVKDMRNVGVSDGAAREDSVVSGEALDLEPDDKDEAQFRDALVSDETIVLDRSMLGRARADEEPAGDVVTGEDVTSRLDEIFGEEDVGEESSDLLSSDIPEENAEDNRPMAEFYTVAGTAATEGSARSEVLEHLDTEVDLESLTDRTNEAAGVPGAAVETTEEVAETAESATTDDVTQGLEAVLGSGSESEESIGIVEDAIPEGDEEGAPAGEFYTVSGTAAGTDTAVPRVRSETDGDALFVDEPTQILPSAVDWPTDAVITAPAEPIDRLDRGVSADPEPEIEEEVLDSIPDEDSDGAEGIGDFYTVDGQTAAGDRTEEETIEEVVAPEELTVIEPGSRIASDDAPATVVGLDDVDIIPEDTVVAADVGGLGDSTEKTVVMAAGELEVYDVFGPETSDLAPVEAVEAPRDEEVAIPETESDEAPFAFAARLEPEPETESDDEPTATQPASSDAVRATAIPDHVLTPTLADIYYQQGQPQLALEIYRRILDRDPDNERILARVSEIEKAVAERSGYAPDAPPPSSRGKAIGRTTGGAPASPEASRERPLKGVRIRKRVRERIGRTRPKKKG